MPPSRGLHITSVPIARLTPRSLDQMYAIARPYYNDCTAVMEREVKHLNTDVYLAHRDQSMTDLLAFFMVGWRNLPPTGSTTTGDVPAVWCGLSVAAESTRQTGLSPAARLFEAFGRDGRARAASLNHAILCYWTTATPFVFLRFPFLAGMQQIEPSLDGSFSAEGAAIVTSIAQQRGYVQDSAHPFVLRGAAKQTQFCLREQTRSRDFARQKRFTLFEQLGVDEQAGDRMLCIARFLP